MGSFFGFFLCFFIFLPKFVLKLNEFNGVLGSFPVKLSLGLGKLLILLLALPIKLPLLLSLRHEPVFLKALPLLRNLILEISNFKLKLLPHPLSLIIPHIRLILDIPLSPY